ncbi:MAG: CAP domain-containing protein [Pseudomonadota bacterium]
MSGIWRRRQKRSRKKRAMSNACALNFFHANLLQRAVSAGILSLVLASCAVDNLSGQAAPAAPKSEYRKLEREVFAETNKLRANPVAYGTVLEGVLERMSGGIYYPRNSDIGIKTKEGEKAVKEALAVLGGKSALSNLKWSEELAELARKHVNDTGPKGLVGHVGSKGEGFSERLSAVFESGKFTFSSENLAYGYSNAEDIVLQLIIDDGVPGRGHRKNMLKVKINYTGIGCGYHREYGHMCAAIYAYRK